jgi:hypothetical protein
MTRIKCYAISCSSDGSDIDVRNIYIWGEQGTSNWLPDSVKEVKHRIEICRLQHNCSLCDSEIHEIVIERNRSTKAQIFSIPPKPHKKSTT